MRRTRQNNVDEKNSVDKVVPTQEELEILKGYYLSMSPEEIAISMGIPDDEVGQYVGNLYKKLHTLEAMNKSENLNHRLEEPSPPVREAA